MITTDNIDLGCSCIEKATIDKAIRDIDEGLSSAYNARKQAAKTGQPFVNLVDLRNRLPQNLPEVLWPKLGHLTPQQQRVYEDFARVPKAALSHGNAPQGQAGLAEKVINYFATKTHRDLDCIIFKCP